jgi:hypothetical protein
MIKRHSYIFILSAIFLLLSATGYFIHYLIFRDAHHIFLYLIGDLAFLPLEVLIVVVVIERILSKREKRTKLQKLNMVIGAFFSQAGNYLLSDLLDSFKNKEEICSHLNVTSTWTKKDFQKAIDFASNLPIDVNPETLDLKKLKTFLAQRREFLITLLENPSLLEHDRFTDLLWATTHLDEELQARQSLDNLPPSDRAHIIIDMRRMYDNLASEWLDYVVHLKQDYPYLFSLVLRIHPFQKQRSPFVT